MVLSGSLVKLPDMEVGLTRSHSICIFQMCASRRKLCDCETVSSSSDGRAQKAATKTDSRAVSGEPVDVTSRFGDPKADLSGEGGVVLVCLCHIFPQNLSVHHLFVPTPKHIFPPCVLIEFQSVINEFLNNLNVCQYSDQFSKHIFIFVSCVQGAARPARDEIARLR